MYPRPSSDLQQKLLTNLLSLTFQDRREADNIQQIGASKSNPGKKHYLNS